MKLTQTKESVKKIEKIENPGTDLILSLMLSIIDDVNDETEGGLSGMKLVTEAGDEEGFLDALDNVLVELTNVVAEVDPKEMPEELQFYADEVSARKELAEKVDAQVKQWKETAKQCAEMRAQLSEETKKLEAQRQELKKLEQEKAKLEKEVTDLCITEEGCQKRIAELKEQIANIPQSEKLTELRNEKNELQVKAEKFSALIESALDKKNHDKEWKEHKFELVEEKYREDLDCVQAIMKNWESHLREMIRFAESLEAEKENDYAGN